MIARNTIILFFNVFNFSVLLWKCIVWILNNRLLIFVDHLKLGKSIVFLEVVLSEGIKHGLWQKFHLCTEECCFLILGQICSGCRSWLIQFYKVDIHLGYWMLIKLGRLGIIRWIWGVCIVIVEWAFVIECSSQFIMRFKRIHVVSVVVLTLAKLSVVARVSVFLCFFTVDMLFNRSINTHI